MQIADATCDELTILCAKIKNDNTLRRARGA